VTILDVYTKLVIIWILDVYGREYEIRVLLPYGAHGDNANATRRWLMCENMASSTKPEAYT